MKRININNSITILILFSSLFCMSCAGGARDKDQGAKQESPNILLILIDDMGYSDLGCYGGEIQTPNIDHLAEEGLRFTQFYNAARCCPTRASLLTGLYPHQVGMGGMVLTNGEAEEGPYQGYLGRNAVTIAEVLKEAGYYTAASGKWHVGEHHPNWPTDRGFDNYYGLISGASNYWDITRPKNDKVRRIFGKDSVEYLPPKEGFYMTDALTDNAIRFLGKADSLGKPFFLYLPYTAPHWPLHAKQEDIEKYRGAFTEGWDVLRQKRFEKMIDMGLIDRNWQLSDRDPQVTAWDELSGQEQDGMEVLMEIYAAQIDCLDRGIGRVLQKLEDIGAAENTLVLLLSDNGACAEYDAMGTDFWGNFWDGVAVPGSADSYHSYGGSWANLSNTPFRKYKRRTHEGGISTPLIVRWPGKVAMQGGLCNEPGHIIDIMATICDITGCDYPDEYSGNIISPSTGKSLAPLFKGDSLRNEGPYFWEHEGNRAVRKGDWKLVAFKDKPWELYNIASDRTELHNLIEDEPLIAAKLESLYNQWAKDVGIDQK